MEEEDVMKIKIVSATQVIVVRIAV